MSQSTEGGKAMAREQLDAVIIGAGFAGLCQLHKLRNDLGLNARCYDKAGGVGGNWYCVNTV